MMKFIIKMAKKCLTWSIWIVLSPLRYLYNVLGPKTWFLILDFLVLLAFFVGFAGLVAFMVNPEQTTIWVNDIMHAMGATKIITQENLNNFMLIIMLIPLGWIIIRGTWLAWRKAKNNGTGKARTPRRDDAPPAPQVIYQQAPQVVYQQAPQPQAPNNNNNILI